VLSVVNAVIESSTILEGCSVRAVKEKGQSNRRVLLVFGAAFFALVVVGGFSYRSIAITQKSGQWVEHTRDVLKNIQLMRLAMETLSSGLRGYIISGREAYLANYQAAKLDIEPYRLAVRDLTVDNPQQQFRVAALDTLIVERLQRTERIIALRRAEGLEAAVAAVRDERGEQITNEFQAIVQEMQNAESILLDTRKAEAARSLSQTNGVLIADTLLGLLITGAAGWSVSRDNTKREIAEAALLDSEQKYRRLVDGVPDYAILMLGPEGEIRSWNPGAERMSGYTWEEVAGQNFSRFYTSEDIERGRPQEVLRIATVNGAHEEQGMRVRKGGKQFMVRTTYTASCDQAGNVRGFTVISRDLSGTTESEAKYYGLMEAAPDAMVVVNQSGNIVLLNVQAEKQFGYHRDELLGQKVTSIIPVGFAERLIADGTRTAEDALAQQIGTGIELTALRKDGSEFPIELMLSPLESAEGTLVTAAIRNISVRKAADKVLAQMEGRYRGLLEAAPDAMVVVNQAGEIVLLNLQAEKQFGYRRNELLGQKVEHIIPSGFAERLVADGLRSEADALAQQIGTGLELHGRRKDGSEFPIELMLSPLGSDNGILITSAIRDITARKKAEAHLFLKMEELNRSNEELGQFAYIASHDLQEPLRMVASYTQLLSRRYKGKLDADADEFIAFAVDGASRMQRLIQDLLLYSRIQSKGVELHETSSEEAVDRAIINLRGAIEASGAHVTHDALPPVLADEAQLAQLFQNLIGNAIKYQKPGTPEIHISAAMNGDDKWIFSVKDNGLGIDPQYFEKIFGMFQRLHKREEFAGTGIGLAVCKKIVERHGGNISVESQPGYGSTFRFALGNGQTKQLCTSESMECP
jgi:PAS domain S-box-containing protein